MALGRLPEWLPAWCREYLGSEPLDMSFRFDQMSTVLGLKMADGTDVVVKARPEDGRAGSCVEAQAVLARRGFPCARPVTPVVVIGQLAVHAEESRPGGDLLCGDSPDVAIRYGEVFAWLMAEPAGVSVAPPLPNPRWVRWDHADSEVWPSIDFLDALDQRAVPGFIVETAQRVRRRLFSCGMPAVLGHADFEAQNLRWHDRDLWAVHDWDSLAWQPEPALAGAASASFASARPATLASIESSQAFLHAYQHTRGHSFTREETEVAWAAGLWVAAHNSRWEALHGANPVAGEALRAQGPERLRRANA